MVVVQNLRSNFSPWTMSLPSIHPKPERRQPGHAPKTRTSAFVPAPLEWPRPIRTGNCGEDVLRLMDSLRLPVDADVYASLLRDCAARGDAYDIHRVHEHILLNAARFLRAPTGALLMNRLLLAYVAAGDERGALEMFDGMPLTARGWVSWAIVIAGLSKAGGHAGALRLFAEMLGERGIVDGGSRLASIIVAGVIRSCGETGNVEFGRCMHGLVLKMGLASCLRSSLVRLYSLLGREDDALCVPSFLLIGARQATCLKTRKTVRLLDRAKLNVDAVVGAGDETFNDIVIQNWRRKCRNNQAWLLYKCHFRISSYGVYFTGTIKPVCQSAMHAVVLVPIADDGYVWTKIFFLSLSLLYLSLSSLSLFSLSLSLSLRCSPVAV